MGNRREQRTRIALPVKVLTRDAQNRPLTEMACSIDISPKGARLTGVRSVKAPGEVISVERGKSKAFFQVKWVGSREQGTEGHGQHHGGQRPTGRLGHAHRAVPARIRQQVRAQQDKQATGNRRPAPGGDLK